MKVHEKYLGLLKLYQILDRMFILEKELQIIGFTSTVIGAK